LLSGIYPSEKRAINLDADWFYRKAGVAFLRFCNVPLSSVRLSVQNSLSRLVNSVAKVSGDPILIPELAIRYIHLKFAKALLHADKSQRSRNNLADIEFKFRRLQEISERGREYGADMPQKPIGLGVLLAFILILFYLAVYLFI
jgi:hypothetical protein